MDKKKRGRPASGESRAYQYRIRLSEDEAEMLEYLCDREGKTKADILIKGLMIQYNIGKFN